MAENERGPIMMKRYVWLINTIYRAKRISFKDINERWRNDFDMSRGENLSIRTFKRWSDNIWNLFGLIISNEHCGDYCYFIENIEDITDGGLQSWLFNTFTVSNALTGCMSLKDRIQLEYVPSGQEYLQPIIEAMKENRVVNMTYYNHWENEEKNYDVQPLCVKLYRQRWYMVGRGNFSNPDNEAMWIYCLDRIRYLQVKDETFKTPKDWSPKEYFEGCFGVIRDHDIDKEIVKLKVNAGQANYIRGLRLHESQKEVERNDEYSIFTLFIRPTQDFMQEMLWNHDNMEVLEPSWFREIMAKTTERMFNRYKKD